MGLLNLKVLFFDLLPEGMVDLPVLFEFAVEKAVILIDLRDNSVL